MDLANKPSSNHTAAPPPVRIATEADARAILRLLKTAPYNHVHADWHLPVDWLGTPGFVVQQSADSKPSKRPTLVTQILGPSQGLQACFAVAADPLPAAWVRVASMLEVERPKATLEQMLVKSLEYLGELGAIELGWLGADGWPATWLKELSFESVNEIETYLKDELTLPSSLSVPGLTIRAARHSDMDVLEQIEAAAFVPIWRHSADSLSLALYQASSFDVALLDERVVGFQLSTASADIAHLVRLTVEPTLHGRGIGSALLAHAIEGYRTKGLRRVTLNTQVDNIASQFLYRKFGFYASGQRLPLWSREV